MILIPLFLWTLGILCFGFGLGYTVGKGEAEKGIKP